GQQDLIMISDNSNCSSEQPSTVVDIGCGRALQQSHYVTQGGVHVQRSIHEVADVQLALSRLRRALDTRRGVLLSSTFEYPGRYRRYDIGFVNPPLVITMRRDVVEIAALNRRGEIMLPELQRALADLAV